MKLQYYFSLLMAAIVFTAAGCGGGSSTMMNNTQNATASVRVLQGDATAGTVSMMVDGATVDAGIPYLSASGYMPVRLGSRVTVQGALKVVDGPLNLAANSQNTLIADGWGTFSGGSVLVADDTSAAPGGAAKLRIVNANLASLLDIFVLPAGGTPTGAPTIAGTNFNTVSAYQVLTPGNYDVFFTTGGTLTTVFHTGTITLGAGQNRTVVLLNDCTPTACNTAGTFRSMTLADLN